MSPLIAGYWEKAAFPFELVPKLAQLGLAGATLKGNGCPGQSILAAVSARHTPETHMQRDRHAHTNDIDELFLSLAGLR